MPEAARPPLFTHPRGTPEFDFDWIVVGSGFGGSVAAMRLAEKGHRVAVVERGRHYADNDLPKSASDRRRFLWAPALGLRGIMRNTLFPHVFSSSQTGVGGGSLVYGGVLFRAHRAFFEEDNGPRWRRGSRFWRRTTPRPSTCWALRRPRGSR